MPDWSYRTVFRPLLSLLPWPTARAIAFGFLGGLNRQPGGGAVIDFLGHLRPDARLSRRFVEGVPLRSSLGLSPALDLDAVAIGALARFGFGFIELGPLILSGSHGGSSTWSVRDEEIVVAIVDAIKSDSLLAPQLTHIVVGSVNRFVKLQGWTDSTRSNERLMELVRKAGCPTAVNVNRFEETPPPADSPLRPQPGGCAPGLKPCGDVCIPDGDSCSDKGGKASD